MFKYQNQEENFRFVLSNHVDKEHASLSVTGVNNTLSAYLTSQLYKLKDKSILVVVANSDDAQKYVKDLNCFIGYNSPKEIIYFPAYNISPLKRVSYHNKISYKRIECLYNLLKNDSNMIIVTDLSGLRQKLIPKEVLIRYADLIKVEEKINFEALVDKLTCGGYRRTVVVEEPGDFSVRCGIIDFFPPKYRKPVRIEFAEDLVESIRLFSPVNQRSVHNIEEILILPACETVFEKSRLNSIIGSVRARAVKQGLSHDYIRKVVKNIKIKKSFPGIEKMTPLIYENMDSLFDYLQESTTVVTVDRSQLAMSAAVLEKETAMNFNKALKSGEICMTPEALFLDFLSIEREILSENSIDYKALGFVKYDDSDYEDYLDIKCLYDTDITLAMEKAKTSDSFFSPLFHVLSKNKSSGYLTVLICSSKNQIKRISSILALIGIEYTVTLGFPNVIKRDSLLCVCLGTITSGFILPEDFLVVITYEEIFGRKSRPRRIDYSEFKEESLDIEDLKVSDFVVHDEHGIGQYNGLIKLNMDGVVGEFLLITYRNDDKLYLPVDHMELVHRYMVGIEEGCIPFLDKIGGGSWERSKSKARASAEKIAGVMLEVYAKRKIQKGHSFLCNDKSLNDFESQFEHEETPDQLKAILDVLKDMKKPVPMDRLVCGDVGYGKTEVALRASFVAVSEGKQVAVLVPTTVLAEQHFATFSSRFKGYSVKIGCLSRFKSRKEQKHLIKNIKYGAVDIVVGTHRLLQNDVSFMDLGLVVLDEEQRFGVKHKEMLKEIRNSVDVLALTATPIPRTLHLSLMGIRDISVISTPPDQRRSIITYVCEFDDEVIANAIRNELDRNGQIFFIHNDISTIKMLAYRLKSYVPKVRLEVAHGHMTEENLERVMKAFVDGKIDMLVCTTIIESGIDVARANTIMVNRADRFGLAQMYQIRGRVGRSDEQAYAYLFVPGENVLGDKASKRLKVLMEHSDLGSGFQIAMNDMKIRGGGTILGASQSGYISTVGYDMFLRLMEESIAKLKGKPLEVSLETEINVSMEAFIPGEYIPDTDQRLSMYRRFAKAKQLGDLSSLKEEFVDRFGQIPEETKNLFLKIMLKILACRAGVKKLDIFDDRALLSFSKKHQRRPSEITTMVNEGNGSYTITSGGIFVAKITGVTLMSNLVQVRNILIEVTRHVSS